MRPFICATSKTPKLFIKFVASYLKNAKNSLKKPIVYYEGNENWFHDLIDSLDPVEKIEQGTVNTKELNFDKRVIYEFPEIIKNKYRNERILFLDAAGIFSNQFDEAIRNAIEYTDRYGGVKVITFFGYSQDYNPEIHNKENWFFYKFDGKRLRGRLAIMFKPEVFDFWLSYKNRIFAYNGTWEQKIGKFLEESGFKFYCSHLHYVQIQLGRSIDDKYIKYQQSDRFFNQHKVNGSLISVIFPTRGRKDLLKKSLKSLIDNSDDYFNNVEILLAMDNDDYETVRDLLADEELFLYFKNIKIIITERYYYKNLHKYVNGLCKIASGDWLFLWNDDCFMKSKGWDTEILKHQDFSILIVDTINGGFGGLPFPIIPKKWFELTGRFSNNCSCDTWVFYVANHVENFKNIKKDLSSVKVFHERFPETGKNNDTTFQETEYDGCKFHSQNDERLEDATRIIKYLKRG